MMLAVVLYMIGVGAGRGAGAGVGVRESIPCSHYAPRVMMFLPSSNCGC